MISALRARAEMLAREQSALRRVATAVVDGLSATEIYAMVAAELAALFDCEGAGILRCQDDTVVVAGAYGEHSSSLYREGSVWPVDPRRRRRPRAAGHDAGSRRPPSRGEPDGSGGAIRPPSWLR